MKLTTLQTQTLQAVGRNEVRQENFGYGAWRVVGASGPSVGRLVSLGLVRWTEFIGGKAELTDQGRVALDRGGQTDA